MSLVRNLVEGFIRLRGEGEGKKGCERTGVGGDADHLGVLLAFGQKGDKGRGKVIVPQHINLFKPRVSKGKRPEE